MKKLRNIPAAAFARGAAIAEFLKMKDESKSDLASQMETARELLDEGEVREALVLALDVLWAELDKLQDTIKTLEENLSQDKTEGIEPADPGSNEYIWPEMLSQLSH
ncbi:MAG: hypothetical protein M1438_13270 [Deltaproteobacteria bacterium]|nr:hypothetical protein [Deltaproteobacteria bacterium]